MPFTPPPVDRPDRLPQWDGGQMSSLQDFLARFGADLSTRVPLTWDSAAQAASAMASDGLALTPYFGVTGDPAVYSMLTGVPVRIGPGIQAAVFVVTLTFAADNAWVKVDVPLGDAFNGQPPHFAVCSPLTTWTGTVGGAYEVTAQVAYTASADNPDWDASRIRVVGKVQPVYPGPGTLTRAALLLAIRLED